MDGEVTVFSNSQPDRAAVTAGDVEPASVEAGTPGETPDSQTPEQDTDQPDDAPETVDRGSHQSRRSLKLVLTLAPIDNAGFRCLLAVGADHCDPLLRSVEVLDLPAALQEAASLVAAGEERWQSQPRNTAFIKKPGGTSAKRSGAKQESPDEPSHEPVTPAPDSESAQSGQLRLFG
jgi:hypothetical protein